MRIVIIGMGYVGLPLAIEFGKKFKTIGFDINQKRIDELNEGLDSTMEVGFLDFESSKCKFTTNCKDINGADYYIVTVPTPIDDAKKPDLNPLISASKTVGKAIKKGSIVIYESTVYPGATEEVCIPIVEKESNLKFNEDFFAGYSPERINPGDKERRLPNILKITSGSTPKIADKIDKLYNKIIKAGTYKAPSMKVAEAAKVIENTQRDMNIALVNELALIFNKVGVDTLEVLEAAGTKWNFLPFRPGLVGGHCLESQSLLSVEIDNKLTTVSFKELYDMVDNDEFYVDGSCCKFVNRKIFAISFNENKKKIEYRKIEILSKTKHQNKIEFRFSNGEYLTTSDKHPFLIRDESGMSVKFAKNITTEDWVPFTVGFPKKKYDDKINFIDFLVNSMPELISKVRVKIDGEHWRDYKEFINKSKLGVRVSNFIYWNYLPLKEYLKIRKDLKLNERSLLLVTGRGKMSYSELKAVIDLDDDFARLIGYYLSEGCISSGYKIRITINKSEDEFLEDLCNIVGGFGLNCSIYQDKTYNAQTIKISNRILGEYFNYLGVGKDSYDACIPSVLFDNERDEVRLNVLKGLFSGDGGIGDNTRNVNYYTISEKMYHQMFMLLHDFKFNPNGSVRGGLFTINAVKDLERMLDWFTDDKKDRLLRIVNSKTRKVVNNKNYFYDNDLNLFFVKVRSIENIDCNEFLYSMEVESNHNFVASSGILTHNCISVDPYYLTYKSEMLGYHPEVILAGRRVNDSIANFVAQEVVKLMIGKSILVNNAKVLVLGITFKENCPDVRNSGAVNVVEEIQSFGCRVDVYDSWANSEEVQEEYGIELISSLSEEYDAIVLTVAHECFKEIDLKNISHDSTVVYDIKYAFDKELTDGRL